MGYGRASSRGFSDEVIAVHNKDILILGCRGKTVRDFAVLQKVVCRRRVDKDRLTKDVIAGETSDYVLFIYTKVGGYRTFKM